MTSTPELKFCVKQISNTFPIVKTLSYGTKPHIETTINRDGEFRVDFVLTHDLFSADEGDRAQTLPNILDDEDNLRGIMWNGSNCMILNEVRDFNGESHGPNRTSQYCKSGVKKFIVPKEKQNGLVKSYRFSIVFDVDLLNKNTAPNTYNVNGSFYLVTKKQLVLVPNLFFNVTVIGERGALTQDFENLVDEADSIGLVDTIPGASSRSNGLFRMLLFRICGM